MSRITTGRGTVDARSKLILKFSTSGAIVLTMAADNYFREHRINHPSIIPKKYRCRVGNLGSPRRYRLIGKQCSSLANPTGVSRKYRNREVKYRENRDIPTRRGANPRQSSPWIRDYFRGHFNYRKAQDGQWNRTSLSRDCLGPAAKGERPGVRSIYAAGH